MDRRGETPPSEFYEAVASLLRGWTKVLERGVGVDKITVEVDTPLQEENLWQWFHVKDGLSVLEMDRRGEQRGFRLWWMGNDCGTWGYDPEIGTAADEFIAAYKKLYGKCQRQKEDEAIADFIARVD